MADQRRYIDPVTGEVVDAQGNPIATDSTLAEQQIGADEAQEVQGPTEAIPFRFTQQELNPRAQAVQGIQSRDPRARSAFQGIQAATGAAGGAGPYLSRYLDRGLTEWQATLASGLGVNAKKAKQALGYDIQEGVGGRRGTFNEYKDYLNVPFLRKGRHTEDQIREALSAETQGDWETARKPHEFSDEEVKAAYQRVGHSAQRSGKRPEGSASIFRFLANLPRPTAERLLQDKKFDDPRVLGGLAEMGVRDLDKFSMAGMARRQVLDKMGVDMLDKWRINQRRGNLSGKDQRKLDRINAQIEEVEGSDRYGELFAKKQASEIRKVAKDKGRVKSDWKGAVVKGLVQGLATYINPVFGAAMSAFMTGAETGWDLKQMGMAAGPGLAMSMIPGGGGLARIGSGAQGLPGTGTEFARQNAMRLGTQYAGTASKAAIGIGSGVASGGFASANATRLAAQYGSPASQQAAGLGSTAAQPGILSRLGDVASDIRDVSRTPAGQLGIQGGKAVVGGIRQSQAEQAAIDQAMAAAAPQSAAMQRGIQSGLAAQQARGIFSRKLPDNPYYDPRLYDDLSSGQGAVV